MQAPLSGGPSWNGTATNAWPSTIWELVRRSREGPPDERRRALDDLFRQYYKPVFRFFQKALRVDDRNLEDLTQDFFTRFVEKDFLKNLEHEKSFRGFLKVACRRHFFNWLESRAAARRSGGRSVALDEAAVTEERIDGMIDDELRTWYLEEAVEWTKSELSSQGKEAYFRLFEARAGLRDGVPADYQSLANEFGLAVYDVCNQLMAARRIFRQGLVELASERSPDPMEELAELGLRKYVL